MKLLEEYIKKTGEMFCPLARIDECRFLMAIVQTRKGMAKISIKTQKYTQGAR